MARILGEEGYEVEVLLGAEATRRNIIDTIELHKKHAQEGDLLVIYFGGHGALDEEGRAYLVPVDGDLAALSSTAIRLDDVASRHLERVSNAVTILDCCYSGQAAGMRGEEEPHEQDTRARAFSSEVGSAFQRAQGRVVLAACGGQQTTRELQKLGHGAFTYYLLDCLQTTPEAVTTSSLFAYTNRGLLQEGLPKAVYGGIHQGEIELRGPRSAKDILVPITEEAISERALHLQDLRRASRARSMERWQAAGLSRIESMVFAENLQIGKPTSAMLPSEEMPLVLLTGELGAGKSLFGERIHLLTVDRAEADANAPLPVYLRARDITGRLDDAIEAATRGLGNPSRQGAAVVVDGADEAGLARASELLSQARILVEQWPFTTVVFTSRPIPEYADAREAVSVPLLIPDQSFALMDEIAGAEASDQPSRRQAGFMVQATASIADAITRPLFALLAGIYLRDMPEGTQPSKVELINHLVERSLRGIAMAPAQSIKVLQRLALLSVDREGHDVPKQEVGSNAELQALLETRLIVESPTGVNFPLPIYAEWFAARSLMEGDPTPSALLIDPSRLERWRFSLITYVGTTDYEAASRLLDPLVRTNPGMASSIINDGLASWAAKGDIGLPSALVCGTLIRRTMEAWVEGIGPLAKLIAPVAEDGSLLKLGVSTNPDGSLLTAWYRSTAPDVFELTPQMVRDIGLFRLGLQPKPLDLERSRKQKPTNLPAWPWKWSLDILNSALSDLVLNYDLPLTTGPLVRESAWRTALALLNNRDVRYVEQLPGPDGRPVDVQVLRGGSLDENPIPLDQIEPIVARFKGTYFTRDRGRHSTNPRREWLYNLDHLRLEIARLRSEGQAEMTSPRPIADQDFPEGGGYEWEMFSEERIRIRAEAVYSAAFEGYQQLVATWFPRLAPRLAHAVLLPSRLVGIVTVPQRAPDGRYSGHLGPGITYFFEPLPEDALSAVDIQLGSEDEVYDLEFRDRLFERLRQQIRYLRPHAAGWLHPWLTSSVLDIFCSELDRYAAAEIAFKWLSNDLKEIGWPPRGLLGF